VTNTPGKLNYCQIFHQASVSEPVSLVLLKKCGWFCMLVKF